MTTLNIGDQITLSDNNKYLCIEVIPLGDQTFYALQKQDDKKFRFGRFTKDDDVVFAEDQPTIERIQKYLAQLSEE